MKKIRRIVLFQLLVAVFVGLIIFPSCNEKKSQIKNCGDPAPPFIGIGLVDTNDSLLIGHLYNPDSIQLFVNNMKVNMRVDEGYMWITYTGLDIYSLKNYYLYLSYKDTDTLNLAISSHYDEYCGTSYIFNGLKYNSKTIPHVPGNILMFKIIK